MSIKTMKHTNKSSDEEIRDSIEKTDSKKLQSIVDGSYIENFDSQVERFLKKQMSSQEEKEFLTLLASSAELESRAKLMAITIHDLKHSQKEKDLEIIETIKNVSDDRLKQMLEFLQNRSRRPRIAAFTCPSSGSEPSRSFTEKKLKKASSSDNENKDNSKQTGKNKTRIIPLFRHLSIAASVALIFGIGVHQYHVSGIKDLGSSHELMAFRSTSSQEFDQKVQAISNLTANSDSLSKVQDKIHELEEQYSVKGITAQEFNPQDQTIVILKWNLALSYLKDGDGREAKKVLRDIADNYSSLPIANEAKKLIAEIENIYWFNF